MTELKMTNAALAAEAENILYKTYSRFPVAFERGEGVYLYDADGVRYLDFGAGIAVCALGYSNRRVKQVMTAQLDKLMHCSNLFYNEPAVRAGRRLLSCSGMERVFFTNSGTEAIEGALKISRRHAYNRGIRQPELIAMEGSFHGRSLGALAVTGKQRYREPFEPLMEPVHFARFNDLDSVKALINEHSSAIIVEPIQGEGGIFPAEPAFLQGLRELCDAHGLLLIFDEIQCGMGRSGHYFAWQHYGVCPDVLTVAKALGNGVPIGAFLARGEAAFALVPGDHGSTYGGNPFACAAAAAVLEVFEAEQLPQKAAELGGYLWEKLDALCEKYAIIRAHRGLGLMQGLEFVPEQPAADIVREALLSERLVLIGAEHNTIRFVPPLIIEKKHVDEMLEKLEAVLDRRIEH